jgi:hypothetical protein
LSYGFVPIQGEPFACVRHSPHQLISGPVQPVPESLRRSARARAHKRHRALWYRGGVPSVPIRRLLVRDPSGELDPQDCSKKFDGREGAVSDQDNISRAWRAQSSRVKIESVVNSNLVNAPAVGQAHQYDANRSDIGQDAAQFTKFDIEPSRGAYMIVDRRTSNPIARLRPIPDTDRFELFYCSNVKARWATFGNMGRMKLMLKSAHEIVENDPILRVRRSR